MNWYDSSDDSESVIMPGHQIGGYLADRGSPAGFGISDRLMMLMSRGDVRHLAEKYAINEETHPIPAFLWKHRLYSLRGEVPVSIIEEALSAPVAVDALEVAIAMGCGTLFAFGLCGAVGEHVNVGDIVIPTEVVREEGTSYHYLPPGADASPDSELAKALIEHLETNHWPGVHIGKTVSTDAVYRQTIRKERAWRDDGILGVDMEMSALMTVAGYHRVPAACLLVVSDKHDLEGRSTWRWGGENLATARKAAIELYLDFAVSYETS